MIIEVLSFLFLFLSAPLVLDTHQPQMMVTYINAAKRNIIKKNNISTISSNLKVKVNDMNSYSLIYDK